MAKPPIEFGKPVSLGKPPTPTSSCYADRFLTAAELEAEMVKEPKLREVVEDRKRRMAGWTGNEALFRAEYMALPVEDPKRIIAYYLCLLYQVRTEEVDREMPHKIVRGEAQVAPWRRRDSNDNATIELRILKAAAARLDISSELIHREMDAAARLSFEAQREELQRLPEEVKVAHAWAIACYGQSAMVLMPVNSDGFKDFNDTMERCQKSLSHFVETVAAVGGSLAASKIHAEYTEAVRKRESVTFNINRQIFAATVTISEERGVLYRQVGYVAAPVRIGITIPGPKNNRLRKFVQRRGLLVEVRARGRTGHRSLQEAVAAAIASKKLSGFSIGRILIDDAVVKQESP